MTELDALEAEAATLVLTRFGEAEAWTLGCTIVAAAQAAGHPVVVNIRTADRCLFHAALPGATPLNDLWAARKSATALAFHDSSLAVGLRLAATGTSLATQGLSAATHSDHGGAVPVRVAGLGVVAVATVSGLPMRDDHALVVAGIRALMGGG